MSKWKIRMNETNQQRRPATIGMLVGGVGAALMLAVASASHAATINVPADQPSIQAAINASSNGDVVIVAPGEYFEAIDFVGKAITVRSTDPYDPGVVMNTVINGNGALHVVQCASGEGPDTVLSGFVVTGGNANGAVPDHVGGGMNNSGSSPMVMNCTFSGNSAEVGGGMANGRGSPTVTNCAFNGNTSVQYGAGMYNDQTTVTVSDCTFTGNAATTFGGGMVNANADPTVTNCTFDGNTAAFGGGGMDNFAGSVPVVTNTGFCGNTPVAIAGDPITDGGGNSLLFCAPSLPDPEGKKGVGSLCLPDSHALDGYSWGCRDDRGWR